MKDIAPSTWLLIVVFTFAIGIATDWVVSSQFRSEPELEPQCIEGIFSIFDEDDLLTIEDIRLCSEGEWTIDLIPSPPPLPYFGPGTSNLKRSSS